MIARCPTLLAALTVAAVVLSCGPRDASEDFLRRETEELLKRTVPPNSRLLKRSEVRRRSQGKVAEWEFETDWNWAQYEPWLTQRLHHDFTMRRVDGARLLFLRPLSGDTEELLVEAAPGGLQLRVRATLVVYPD